MNNRRTISLSQYFSHSLTWICQNIFSSVVQPNQEGIAQGHAHGELPTIP
jgi:hypothetical protein